MRRHIAPEIAPPNLFPLPPDALSEYLNTFSGFTDDELAMVTGSNRNLATDPTDLAYPLLNLQVSPDLLGQEQEGDPYFDHRAQAYRAGVCVGLVIVRGRQEALGLPPLTVDPSRRYSPPPPTRLQRLAKLLLGPFIDVDELGKITAATAYASYFSDEQSVWHAGYLKAYWLGRMDFLQESDVLADVPDYISIGMADTFALANSAQNQLPAAELRQQRHRGIRAYLGRMVTRRAAPRAHPVPGHGGKV